MFTTTRTRAASLFIGLTLLTASAMGCSEDTEYKQAFAFPVTANLANAEYINAAGEDVSTSVGEAATEDLTSKPLLFNVSVDMETPNPDLAAAAQGSELDSLTIDQILYTVTNNSADVATQPMDLYLVPEGVTTLPEDRGGSGEDAPVLMGTIPSIPAGEQTSGEVILYPENFAAAQMHVFDLKFNVISETGLAVATGDPVPGGQIEATVDVQMTITTK